MRSDCLKSKGLAIENSDNCQKMGDSTRVLQSRRVRQEEKT
jgi:hypothetical protein